MLRYIYLISSPLCIIIRTDDAVSMPALQNFPYQIEGGNDLIERTAQQFKKIGITLLHDKDGSIVENIEMGHHHKPVPTMRTIYEKWIRRSRDHSWKILVQCWRDCDHAVLASEVETILTSIIYKHNI